MMSGLMLVIIAAFSYSAKAILIKLAYGYGAQITPLMLMTLRMVLSLPFFLVAIVLLERNQQTPLTRQDMIHLLGLGVIGFYLAAYLDFVGLSYISASLERLILMLYPTLVVLLSAIFLQRPIRTPEVVALVLSYGGIVIVFAKELILAGPDVILGAAFIFGSTTAFSIYLIGSGEMVKRLGSTRFTAYAMTIASIATLLHFGLRYDPVILHLPAPVYGLALIMAVFSTVIPAFFMNAGIERIGAGPAAIISAVGPVITIFLAYLVLDEQLTFVQFLGATLVIAGALIVSRAKDTKPT
ncbi:MAG: DMT family transporter [Gammaproteobacteria bacterium]|nr:DMT family transporter [Gammaproteobacteria bacterium]